MNDILTTTEHRGWLELIEKAGLLDEVLTAENITMFVPRNEAVEASGLADASVEELADIIRWDVTH